MSYGVPLVYNEALRRNITGGGGTAPTQEDLSMSRVKRFILLTASLLVALAAVFGVAYWSASYNPEDPNPGLYIDGRRVSNPGTIITVGGNEIDFDEYRFYYYNTKYQIEMTQYAQNSPMPTWDEDPDGEWAYMLQSRTNDALVNTYAWLAKAQEMNITLTDEEKQEAMKLVEEQRTAMGGGYEEWLKSIYLNTEEAFIRLQEQQTLIAKVQTALQEQIRGDNEEAAGDAADADYLKNYISAKHILFMLKTDEQYEADRTAAEAGETAEVISEYLDADTGEALSEAQIADKAKTDTLARAERLLQEIEEAEDPIAAFDTAMNELSEDGGLATNPDGYTFAMGMMVDIFYQTALDLDEYEISQPVLSESGNYSGYHIIMRIPLSQTEMEANRTAAVNAKVNALLTEEQTKIVDATQVQYGEYYDEINPQSVV